MQFIRPRGFFTIHIFQSFWVLFFCQRSFTTLCVTMVQDDVVFRLKKFTFRRYITFLQKASHSARISLSDVTNLCSLILVIIHCTQYEVPFARLRKYFMFFSPSLYHLILHLENFPQCAVSLSPPVRLWEIKEKRGRGNKSTVNQDHS